MTVTYGEMFAGCGLLSLGLERAGMTPRWFAETDKAASSVLARHWPTVPNLGDVKEMTKKAEEEKIEAAKVATEPEAAVEETVEKIPAAEPVAEEVEEAPATEEVVAKDTKNSAGSEETEEVVDAEAREGALNKKLDEILGK